MSVSGENANTQRMLTTVGHQQCCFFSECLLCSNLAPPYLALNHPPFALPARVSFSKVLEAESDLKFFGHGTGIHWHLAELNS